MKTILITTNDLQEKTVLASLSNKNAKKIDSIKYLGGFLRFNSELYSEVKESNAIDYKGLLLWLNKNVFNN